MSLIGRVGSRRPRARIALLVLYALLTLGAITTIYPFLLMVGTSFKGPTDQNDNRLIPKFWSDDAELLDKYVQDKYAGAASAIDGTRTGQTADPKLIARYNRFLMSLPPDMWSTGFRTGSNQATGRLTVRYQQWLRGRFSTIDQLNRAYIEENTSFSSVGPPNENFGRKGWKPLAGRKWQDWLVFKQTLFAEFRIPVLEQRMYQEFLRAKYQNALSAVPAELAKGARSFETISIVPSGRPYAEFLRDGLPDRYRRATVESLWQREASGFGLPIEAAERTFVAANSGSIRQEMSTRNYRFALGYILLNGRVLFNTFLFCALAVLTQLIVNPLAAYALSRYPMPWTGKMLLFLLATMAFPAEVAMIPAFLLLKDLGLLNTFAALVLPGAASGYMIFLLKGFFDSLPHELFESGQIDGAKELTMLTRIALPLSRPVLGYLGLLAFMGAYGAFMYAFLVAQDYRMWTLMVWIYQLQITAPKATMMAALTLAAIPTLLVFLFAQRVILRGIILPGER